MFSPSRYAFGAIDVHRDEERLLVVRPGPGGPTEDENGNLRSPQQQSHRGPSTSPSSWNDVLFERPCALGKGRGPMLLTLDADQEFFRETTVKFLREHVPPSALRRL